MTSLTNITKSSLAEEAARVIRSGIMSGEIAPGEIYSVPAISSQLGVSATPVREAMLDLASEGLVVPVRNKGFRVVSLSAHDLENILKIRLMLEVPSMGDVAESHRDEDMARFRVLAEQLPVHVRANQFQAYLDTDQEFHVGLLRLLNNERLVDLVRMLRNQTRLFDVGHLAQSGELIESALEHLQIIEAIDNRDRARTEEVMSRHLMKLRDTWTDQVDALNSAPV